jgi:hypothetical protein
VGADGQPDGVSLRDYVEAMIQREHDLNEVRFVSSQEAVTQFRTTTESRFASVNEFRGTLTDQAGTFATRDALETAVKETAALANRLSTLEARLLAYGGVFAVVLAVASVLVIWLHK